MRRNHGLKAAGATMVLVLLGCNGYSPTAPEAQPPTQVGPRLGIVSGNVYDPSGACVSGAVVEVLDGARAGARATQNTCQGPWDYGDDGYLFRDLPADSNVRLRASRAGFQSGQITVFVTTGWANQSNFVLQPE